MISIDDIPEYVRYKTLHASNERSAEEESEMYLLRTQLHDAGFPTGHLGAPRVNPGRAETYYVWDSAEECLLDARTYTASSAEHAADLEATSWYDDYEDANLTTVAVLPSSALDDLEEPDHVDSFESVAEGYEAWDTYLSEVLSRARMIAYQLIVRAPSVHLSTDTSEQTNGPEEQ